MWLTAAQGPSGGLDPAAVAQLFTAVTAVVIGGASIWRGRHSDQRDEITKLWEREQQLVDRVDVLDAKVDSLRQHVERCETEKARLARQLAEALGGLR